MAGLLNPKLLEKCHFLTTHATIEVVLFSSETGVSMTGLLSPQSPEIIFRSFFFCMYLGNEWVEDFSSGVVAFLIFLQICFGRSGLKLPN